MTDVVAVRGAVRPAGMPNDVPAVPDVPAIPGLRFRGVVERDDVEIAALTNAAAEADGIPERHTAEEFANWLPQDHRDVARDVLLAEVEGRPVGIAVAGWEPDTDGGQNFSAWGAVVPSWRRRGLGTALLGWVEARQRQVAAEHRPAGEKRLESWAYVNEVGRIALLERAGYVPVRYWFEMERPNLSDIPDAALPDGYRFVSGPDADPREVWEVVTLAFQDHFGGMEQGEEAYQGFLSNPHRNPALWVLVEHQGRIVGTALNRISADENASLGVERGRVNAVAVLREHRRHGLGRAIVAESLRVLRDARMQAATLGVDAENAHGAVGLYKSLGFQVVHEGRIYRKPLNG